MTRKARTGKTLAMRVLEGQGVPYEVIEFPATIHDALGVAQHAGLPPHEVYKTLVVQAEEPGFKPMLIMVGADRELALKKVAAAVGARKVHMARQVEAEKLTGLQVGGISALALLNRGFAIYLDLLALDLERVMVSAGQRGLNLRLAVDDLVRVTGAEIIEAS
jgi:Cys-tRNA(Pro)/Cys-tRNA(Cys) deacylase